MSEQQSPLSPSKKNTFELSSQMAELLHNKDHKAVVLNEKIKRCHEFKDGKCGPVTKNFTKNTAKEELVLEHVIQYRRQFNLKYDENKDLQILYPKNECGVYKFICTTLRPTKLAFIPLYDYIQAGQKLSQYIQYEELDIPDRYPTVIPAPSNVLKWQKGDCFDMSNVLCSILLGTGYDAYVCVGRAPREVTTKNESLMINPFIDKGKKQEEQQKVDEYQQLLGTNEFGIKMKQAIISRYEQREKEEKEEEERRKEIEAKIINDEEPDDLPVDQYLNRRLHCWVLIKKGKRNVDSNLFIEPSTGRVYPIEHNPYLSLDFIYNHKNFWINLQDDKEVKEVNLESMNTNEQEWEFVMVDSMDQQKLTGEQLEEDEEDYADENDPEIDQEEYFGELDMPPSWSPKLFIDKENFNKCSLLGEQTAFYLKSKVDQYAKYQQPDGLVMRIVIYEDYRRLKIKESREFFECRSDKLSVRRKYPFKFITEEEYLQGRSPHWKLIVYEDRRRRVIDYYNNRNVDGLVQREEIIGEKTIERYQGRDDRVIYRSCRFYKSIKDSSQNKLNTNTYEYKDNHVDQVTITKMTQKYERNYEMPAHMQIAKMVVDLIKQKVTVYYHMEEKDICPLVKEFPRASMQGFAKTNDSGMGNENKADDPLVQQENQMILQMEKDCQLSIKSQEEKQDEEHKSIKKEELVLEKSLHDKAREKFYQNQNTKDDENKDQREADYLQPYLEKYKLEGQQIEKDVAMSIKKEVMEKLKERLLSRAEIIQKRLEEKKQELDKLNQQLLKRGELLNKDEEKNIEESIEKLNFKIRIMDERADRFEMMAFNKYEEMDRKLNEDPRLQAMNT